MGDLSSGLGPIRRRSLRLLASTLLLTAASLAQITEDSVVTLTATRAPVTGSPPVYQSFIVSPPPGGAAAAKAVLIMLPGRTGNIQLTPAFLTSTLPGSDATLDVNSGNFLVRSRWLFAAEGFVVLSLDAATDFQQLPNGLTFEQGSSAHVTDILQVIAWARSMITGLPAGTPVFVVGTSRGMGGAWVAGENTPPTGPDGVVFTSPINISGDADSLLSAPLSTITVPTFIFNNKAATCANALATNDPPVIKLLTGTKVKANDNVDGGLPSLTSDCDALSPHGYFGVEAQAVRLISNWIIAH